MWSKLKWLIIVMVVGGGLWWLYSAFRTRSVTLPPSAATAGTFDREVEIITLLPKDGIPAIFKPRFLDAAEADEWYNEDELVIGVEIDGDARAYSIPYLSGHEIVNDTVSGRKIAVTW